MEIPSGQSGPLAFGDFLEHLRRQGFTIGVDHHLRLQRLLAQMGGRCAPQDLKTLLCPVFATNEKEQQSFHRAFDSYYDLFQIPDESDGMIDIPPASAGDQEKPTAESDKSKRSFLLIYTALSILLITLAFLIAHNPEVRERLGLADTPAYPPPLSPEPPITPTPEVSPTEATPQVVVTPIQTPLPQWKDATDFVIAHRNAIRIAAIIIPLLCFLIYELIRYRRRKLILERARGRKPPRAWPIVAQSPGLKDYRSERFYKAARGLRRRQVGEFQRLDVARTIASTIEARGYPNFRYRADSRAPEYLILIDRASWRDHQSQLFDALARAMEREGLFTQRYYYDGDPRVCTDDSANRAVHLTDLQKKYSSHRLLIFGDGERLIDPVSGRMASWAAILLEWPDRALLTPEARRGLREKTLADYFILLPATLEGLGELAERFDLPTVAEFDSWGLNGEQSPPDPEGPVKIEALRSYLGEEAFQWLCACAVYPELHWDLTLHLGSAPRMGAGLICEKNLLRLVRLPWFRSGSMPDELRLRLIGELETERERAVRSAIIELLEKNPAPQGTFAADARKLEIAAQRSWLSRDNRKELRREVDEIKKFPPSDIARDYALVRFLESAPSSRLALRLPNWLRKSFYKNGIPAFGLKTVTRGFSAFLIVAATFVGSSLIPNSPAESYAVVVGASRFSNRGIMELPEASFDAELFARHLSSERGGGVKAQNLVLLTGESATTSTLRQAIATAFRERASKQDSVVFYFSSYGQEAKDNRKNLTLFTYDFETAGSYTSAELLRVVKENINHIGRVFIFIDASNAGLVSDQINDLLRETPEARGKIIALLSSKADQRAFNTRVLNIRRGAFTLGLISGLNGEADANRNGLVTLGEIFPFIQQTVKRVMENSKNPFGIVQEPVMAGDMDLNTPLAWPAMPGVDPGNEQTSDITLLPPSPTSVQSPSSAPSPANIAAPTPSPTASPAPLARFSVSPRSLDFGTVNLHNSKARSVVVTNTGTVPYKITSVDIVLTRVAGFEVGKNSCSGANFQPGERCSIEVIFSPLLRVNHYSTNLSINATVGQQTISLTGTVVIPSQPAEPTITEFTATPAGNGIFTICYGMLDAVSARIDPDIGEVQPTKGDCVAYRVPRTTNYTLTAKGRDGRTVSQQLTVSVRPLLPVEIIYFRAQPSLITEAGRAQLCYGVVNARSAHIDQNVGEIRPLEKECVYVSPKQTTTYTLTATGYDGKTVTQRFTLRVGTK